MSQVSGINISNQSPTQTGGSRRTVLDLPSRSERAKTWFTHEVKEGDTIKSLAKEFGVSRSEIRRSNGLRMMQKLDPGSLIIIPGEKPSSEPAETVPVEQPELVKEDLPATLPAGHALPDTVPVEIPQFTSEDLLPLPEKGFDQISYAVENKDTLSRIAKRFYTTVGEIKSLNGLKSNFIRKGQMLKINPGTSTDKGYKSGKTLYSYLVTYADVLRGNKALDIIAAKFSGKGNAEVITAKDIVSVNDLDGKPLYVGQHIWVTKANIIGKEASWYGPGFQGRSMANGRPYDMNKICCAHRSLPFGTKLSFRNVLNGKEVHDVPVWDRGPYVNTDRREFDFSKAVADDLGMIESGVVKIEAIITSLPKMPDLPPLTT